MIYEGVAREGYNFVVSSESAVGTVEGTAGFRVYGRGGSCDEKRTFGGSLVKANMSLALKSRIVQNLKNEGKISSRLVEELDLYTKMYTPDTCIIFIITRMCGRSR